MDTPLNQACMVFPFIINPVLYLKENMNTYRQITSNVMHRFLVTKPDKMSHAILGSIQTSASSEMAGRSERLNSLIPMFYGRLWKSLEIHI